MSRPQAEYQVLLSNRDSLDYETDSAAHNSAAVDTCTHELCATDSNGVGDSRHNEHKIPCLLVWLSAAVVLIAFTDIVALTYTARMFRTVFQDKDFADNLEYANPYIGLEELYASGEVNSSKIDPILVRPRISAQVFLDDVDRFSPRGEHDYWSETFGSLSPNERHLQVSPNVRTIVQFRVIDFGMEDCHLVFTLPNLGVPLEDHASFSMNPSSLFDVIRLDSTRSVNARKLTYRNKPKALEKVATLQPRLDGETLIHQFPCPRGSLHIFEVACGEGSECLLDVWSSQTTGYGVNIYQHQTV